MTVITESFNKADGDTLGPDLTWTETNGDMDIVSNGFVPVTSGGERRARAESDLAGTDHYAQVDVVALGTNTANYIGCAVRFATAADTCYLLRLFGSSGTSTLRITKCVTGTLTDLGTGASVSVSLPDTIKLEVQGSTLRSYFNGVLQETITSETSITTGTRCGVCGRQGTIAAAYKGDNFEAGDLSAAGVGAGVFTGRAFGRGLILGGSAFQCGI